MLCGCLLPEQELGDRSKILLVQRRLSLWPLTTEHEAVVGASLSVLLHCNLGIACIVSFRPSVHGCTCTCDVQGRFYARTHLVFFPRDALLHLFFHVPTFFTAAGCTQQFLLVEVMH